MSTTITKSPLLDCTQAGAILSPDTWYSRVEAFTGSSKYTVLSDRATNIVGSPLVTIFKLDLQGFMELLGKFTRPKYNGIRMHFACYADDPNTSDLIPDGMEGQFCVFFCPTFVNPNSIKTGIDDPEQFWYLGPEGKPIQLSAGLRDTWIQNYRKDQKILLQKDGEKHMKSKDFKETECLWYSMDSIAGGHGDFGLLPYLACQTQPGADNPIIELYIQLSAFTPRDMGYPEYQLTSIFYLRQASDPEPDPSGLTRDDMKHALAFGSSTHPKFGMGADTGIPCPPATNCPG